MYKSLKIKKKKLVALLLILNVTMNLGKGI